MSIGYQFVPIDVDIVAHPKFDKAGPEAAGLWLWGMAFAHKNRLTSIPRTSVLKAWGGKRNIMLAKRLVDSGLWLANEDGSWAIFNFEKKGPGRQSSSADRMRRLRDRRDAEVTSHVTPDLASRDASPPSQSVTSCSVSVSSSKSSSEGECEREVTEVRTKAVADPQQPRPDWWDAALETIAMDTGIDLPKGEAWLRYAGHRGEKRGAPERGHAIYWLTTVMVREAREALSSAARQRDRDAKFDRTRAGPVAEPQKYTPEEQRRLAERFPMRPRPKVAG